MPKDLKKTYNQYLTNLDGKTAILTTPFTPLDCFYIKFDILQLPHLLGLHKIYNEPPKSLCSKLASSSITYEKMAFCQIGLIRSSMSIKVSKSY